MKKLIILLATALFCAGCGEITTKSDGMGGLEISTDDGFKGAARLFEFDGCQYFLCPVHGGYVIVHRARCKYCELRAGMGSGSEQLRDAAWSKLTPEERAALGLRVEK